MNPSNINAILELINRGIQIGGELVPIALRAYAALRDESGLSDDELTTRSIALNDPAGVKLRKLIAETEG